MVYVFLISLSFLFAAVAIESGGCYCQSFSTLKIGTDNFEDAPNSCSMIKGGSPLWASEWQVSLSSYDDEAPVLVEYDPDKSQGFGKFAGSGPYREGPFVLFAPTNETPGSAITRDFYWYGGSFRFTIEMAVGEGNDPLLNSQGQSQPEAADWLLVDVMDVDAARWSSPPAAHAFNSHNGFGSFGGTVGKFGPFPLTDYVRLFRVRVAAVTAQYVVTNSEPDEFFAVSGLALDMDSSTCPIQEDILSQRATARERVDMLKMLAGPLKPALFCRDGLERYSSFSEPIPAIDLLEQSADSPIRSTWPGVLDFDGTRWARTDWPRHRRMAPTNLTSDDRGHSDPSSRTIFFRFMQRRQMSTSGDRILASTYLFDQLNAANLQEWHHDGHFFQVDKWIDTTKNETTPKLRLRFRVGPKTTVQLNAKTLTGVSPRWVSVAFVYSHQSGGAQVRFFVDGSPVAHASTGAGGEPFPSGVLNMTFIPELYIGATGPVRENNEHTRFFNGTVDDLMFFSRALTNSEIEQLHNGDCISSFSPGSKLLVDCKDAVWYFPLIPVQGKEPDLKELILNGNNGLAVLNATEDSLTKLPVIDGSVLGGTSSMSITFQFSLDSTQTEMYTVCLLEAGGNPVDKQFSIPLQWNPGNLRLGIQLSGNTRESLDTRGTHQLGDWKSEIAWNAFPDNGGIHFFSFVFSTSGFVHLYLDGLRTHSLQMGGLIYHYKQNGIQVYVAPSSVHHVWTVDKELLDTEIAQVHQGQCIYELMSNNLIPGLPTVSPTLSTGSPTSMPVLSGNAPTPFLVGGGPTPFPSTSEEEIEVSSSSAATGTDPMPVDATLMTVVGAAAGGGAFLVLILFILLFIIFRLRRRQSVVNTIPSTSLTSLSVGGGGSSHTPRTPRTPRQSRSRSHSRSHSGGGGRSRSSSRSSKRTQTSLSTYGRVETPVQQYAPLSLIQPGSYASTPGAPFNPSGYVASPTYAPGPAGSAIYGSPPSLRSSEQYAQLELARGGNEGGEARSQYNLAGGGPMSTQMNQYESTDSPGLSENPYDSTSAPLNLRSSDQYG